uniref:Putative secreted protein n=1 Tax=Anopheles marajoara TaxID=58244 RepID=A0A2M4CBG0_9DIPT
MLLLMLLLLLLLLLLLRDSRAHDQTSYQQKQHTFYAHKHTHTQPARHARTPYRQAGSASFRVPQRGASATREEHSASLHTS